MQFVLVFGVNYYYDNASVPAFVQHRISWFVTRWGNDLDSAAPIWVRHKASFLLAKWGLLNA